VLLREEFPDVGNNLCVIDGVFNAVAVRRVFAAQTDFQIELHGLRRLFFPRIDADAGFDAQFADEYRVHVGQATGPVGLKWPAPF